MRKRILSLVLSLAMLCAFVPVVATAATSGTCGDNLTWTLDDDGTLEIYGTGKMFSWQFVKDVPWHDYISNINTLIINEGVISISDYAFWYLPNIESVCIPSTVTYIGDSFENCPKLKNIFLPNSIKEMNYYTFLNTDFPNIYYEGSEGDWGEISIGNIKVKNYDLWTNFMNERATIHYNSYISEFDSNGSSEPCATYSNNASNFSTGWYKAKLSDASYGLEILSISEDNITFQVEFVGNNGSPIYDTYEITAPISNDTVSFEWSDTWDNYGNGILKFENEYLLLTMVQTYTAKGNRSTLAQDNIALYPSDASMIKNDDIKIVINGREITPMQEPVIQSGTTLVHIRIFEEVGAAVEWDDSTKTATITKGNRVVQATADDRTLKVNNGEIYGGLIATQIINDYTMVPLRAITEAMGGVVNWIEDTRTIDIYYSDIIDAIIENSTEDDGSSGAILKLASQSNDIRTTFSNFEYCYDYMNTYYEDEFLSGFIMAFDNPFIPIETLANELFNYGSILNYNNKTPKLDLSEAFAAENVADAIAEMIENVSDSSIDLYEVDSEVKTIMSKLKSTSGLVLSEDSSLQGLSCFSEFLKGANFAIKIHDEWSDILESALTDYGVSIEYLNAIEEALTDNGLMDETLADSISRLKVKYNAWFIDEISDFATNQLSSKITSLIGTAVNITGKGTWGFVNFVREGLNVASGNKNRAALLKKIYSYTTIDLPLSRCYTYYADKIYSGDYTTNDVLLCEKLFEICKISRITVYKNVYALNELDTGNIGQYQRYNTDLGISETKMLKSNIEGLENLSY